MTRILVCIVVLVLFLGLGVALVRLASPARVIVTWETASEVETAGFLLYRSQSPDGTFSPITETPVPATGDPLAGASYRYEDGDVVWGERYYYQLEELEAYGGRLRYPELVEVRAGLGWPWALAIGALAGVLAAGLCWMLSGSTR